MVTNTVPAASQAIKKVENFLYRYESKQVATCPVRDVLHSLTDKWSMLIMMVLGQHHTLRFNEIKIHVTGISQKMLTATLRNLEISGMVDRKMYPQIPPKVEYTITPMGTEFLQHLVVMLDWACKNSDTISRLRKKTKKKELVK